MTTAARLGCVIPMTAGKAFAQIHSDEPLLECRVLASAVGSNEEDAIARAMEKAGVTELIEGPRPKAAVAWLDGTREIGRVVHSMSLLDALQICEEAVDGLIGAIR
jgi:hypothetical protein